MTSSGAMDSLLLHSLIRSRALIAAFLVSRSRTAGDSSWSSLSWSTLSSPLVALVSHAALQVGIILPPVGLSFRFAVLILAALIYPSRPSMSSSITASCHQDLGISLCINTISPTLMVCLEVFVPL